MEEILGRKPRDISPAANFAKLDLAFTERWQSLQKVQATHEVLTEKATQLRKNIEGLERASRTDQKALELFNIMSDLAHDNIIRTFAGVLDPAVKTVFGEDHAVSFKFTKKRDAPSLEIEIASAEFDGKGVKLDENHAGGMWDILSFAARLATVVLLGGPRVLILDEQLKWLDQQVSSNRAVEFIQEVAKALDMQVIMSSHNSAFANCGGNIIDVEQASFRSGT